MTTRRHFLLLSYATAALATAWNRSARGEDATTAPSGPMKSFRIPHTNLVVSRIGYGTGLLGGDHPDREPLNSSAAEQATRLIQTAYDHGITFFDLADVYGYGKSEAAFGAVLKSVPGLRNKIVLQSKCGIRWEKEPDGAPRRIDYSRQHITDAVEGSLRRLGTDHLDILLLHHPDPLMQPEEVAHAFHALKTSGKVNFFGVSNHTPCQMELLRKHVHQPLVANQVSIGLAHSELFTEGMPTTMELLHIMPNANSNDSGTVDYCRLNDILLQAYSPLRGLPLGKLTPDTAADQKQLAQTLAEVAERKNVAPSAVALAWLLQHPAGILPITEPRNPNHLIENCAAVRIELTREEWYGLLIAAAGISPTTMTKAT